MSDVTILDGVDPTDLGLPEKFPSFRQVQREATDFTIYGPDGEGSKRIVGLGMPVGSGKSLCAQAIGKVIGGRFVTLTANKVLQDQYKSDFPGIADIRGRSNYTCTGITIESNGRKEHVDCGRGSEEGCRLDGGSNCEYGQFLGHANSESAISTNYQYWMHARARNAKALEGNGPIDVLICDEAHKICEELAQFLNSYIALKDCYAYCGSAHKKGNMPWNRIPDDHGPVDTHWMAFLTTITSNIAGDLQSILREYDNNPYLARQNDQDYARLDKLMISLAMVTRHGNDGNWIWELKEHGVKLSIIWPWRYFEKYVISGVPKVILQSGTLRPKLPKLLGIKRADMDFREWPRQFPAANGMVYHIPTVRMSHNMPPEDLKKAVNRVDEIMQAWRGHKGIIHTASYARAEQFQAMCEYGRHFLLNKRGSDNANQSAVRFREKKLGPLDSCALVSPSYTTGWDFPLGEDETNSYQIIIKVPYHDQSSPIVQARKSDPDYEVYDITQTLVQACGRRNRRESDKCTTFIIDDHIKRFAAAGKTHAPSYFKIYTSEQVKGPK